MAGAAQPARRAEERTYDSEGRARAPVTLPEQRPNLILLVIDTLRFDAVGRRDPGGVDTSMPTLASIGASGVRVAHAVAPAPWTLPSIASLLSGLHPSEHGLELPRQTRALDPSVRTYAEVLSATYGYETAAFVTAGWMSSRMGVLQGFETQGLKFDLRTSADVLGPWLGGRDTSRPFFLLLHTMEAHDPYGERNHRARSGEPVLPGPLLATARTSSDPWELTKAYFLDGQSRALIRARGKDYVDLVLGCMNGPGAQEPDVEVLGELEDRYYEGTRWVDQMLEPTVELLARKGLLENTLLVITSDHGEAFGEHGIVGHGRQLDEELIHVPLVMRGPAPFTGGRTLTCNAGLIDVLPTFFDWAGLRVPRDSRGHSLLPALRGEAPTRPPVLCETHAPPGLLGAPTHVFRRSVRSADWKYEVSYDTAAGTVREAVYDLRRDPLERHDLARSSGRRPTQPPWDAAFEQRVRDAADRVWTRARRTAAQANTVTTMDVAPLRTQRAAAPPHGPDGMR